MKTQVNLKRGVLFVVLFFYLFPLISQDNIISDYFTNTGVYLKIYNGEIDPGYDSKLYTNLPYYKDQAYRSGEVTFKGVKYNDLQIRLDLYKEQIIALLPSRNYGTVLDQKNIDNITIEKDTFIWIPSTKENKLKSGY